MIEKIKIRNMLNIGLTQLETDRLNYHDKYLVKIPEFLDTKRDKRIWIIMYEMTVIQLNLFVDEVYTDEMLDMYVWDWMISFNTLKETAEAKLLMLISIHLDGLLDHLLEYCQSYEYYEACANILKFKEMI